MRTVTIKWAIPIALAAALVAGCGNADDAGTPAPAATSASPAGNGIADQTPDEILKQAKAALLSAKSYRLKGDVVEEGENLSLDLAISGKDVQGKISAGAAQGTVEVLAVGGQQFIRPDEKFWTATAGADQGKTIAKMMGDKWAKVSAKDQDLSELFSLANVDDLLSPTGTVTKGDTKQIDGVDALALLDGGSAAAVPGSPSRTRVSSARLLSSGSSASHARARAASSSSSVIPP